MVRIKEIGGKFDGQKLECEQSKRTMGSFKWFNGPCR